MKIPLLLAHSESNYMSFESTKPHNYNVNHFKIIISQQKKISAAAFCGQSAYTTERAEKLFSVIYRGRYHALHTNTVDFGQVLALNIVSIMGLFMLK